jgi:uncharacterized protein YdiU (UPF0061 family)
MNIMATNQSGWQLAHTYISLPEIFYTKLLPTPVARPAMVLFNQTFAVELGLDPKDLEGERGALIFGGNQLPIGAIPIAQAYAGHQFGQFTNLGDGRAILLGEQRAPDGQLYDIQLKGSGPTPYSRRGDGRAALGPMLREYLISEAMHALGIPTTRSLAVVATGEEVWREHPLPGAILTRVSSSHIRVGTFEFAAAHRDPDKLKALADYTIQRHYPEIMVDDQPYLAFLEAVLDRQVSLVSKWILAGFIHGVMNTDNMALSGETIDYGPCAFMDQFDPDTVFSSIDHQGRYAYANQPSMAYWNLTRFAETLVPLLDTSQEKAVEKAREVLERFPEKFQSLWHNGMKQKLGWEGNQPQDKAMIQELQRIMHASKLDYTFTFRALTQTEGINSYFEESEDFKRWQAQWFTRATMNGKTREQIYAGMNAVNPIFIPRNYLVEEALHHFVQEDNRQPFDTLLKAVCNPFDPDDGNADYLRLPPVSREGYQTFCGT